MRGTLVGCGCALASVGQASTVPSSMLNSRRLILSGRMKSDQSATLTPDAYIGLQPPHCISSSHFVDGGEAEVPHRLGKGLGGYSWPVGSDSRSGWRCSTAC